MRRALVALAIALLAVLACGSPAQAASHALPDVLGCKDAPTPEMPGRGVVGFFESAPKVLPPAGNPFEPGTETSIYEQYGYAGLRFNTYDLGCGPDIARSPDAAVGTAVANWIFQLPKAAIAATGALLGQAFDPTVFATFDPLITQVVEALKASIFERWYLLVMAALGFYIIWRSRKQRLSETATAIAGALLVMVVVTMVFRWPLEAGHKADQSVSVTLGAVSGGLNGKAEGAQSDAATEATAGLHESLLYQTWLAGTFGSADSEVARRYGPVIFAATALTWREAQIVEADPEQGKRIIDAKKQSFEDTASKIEDKDPDAYQYLTGKRSDTRVGYALLAGLGTLCAVPFLFMAALLILAALMVVRFGVMLFPAFATLGLFPTMRGLVTGIGSAVAAGLINGVAFGIGALIEVFAIGILLGPGTGTPPWLDIVLMLLLTIVLWVMLKPFRRLTTMVSAGQFGMSATADEGRKTVGAIKSFGVKVAAIAAGTMTGGAGAAAVTAATQRTEGEAPARVESEPPRVVTDYEPIPAPARSAPAAPANPPASLAAAAPSLTVPDHAPGAPEPAPREDAAVGRFEGGDRGFQGDEPEPDVDAEWRTYQHEEEVAR